MALEVPGQVIFDPKLYEVEGWICVKIMCTLSKLEEARNWLGQECHPGRYDVSWHSGQTAECEFWISDPDVAFAFKMRFG